MAEAAASLTARRRGRKFDQVLDGAREVFLRDGFEGAGVDEIARAAGVSKATLYSYFPDKQRMFMEIARRECEAQAEHALDLGCHNAPPREVLTRAAETVLNFVLSDFAMRIFRICVAESDRFPQLGRDFYESGPALGHARLRAYLEQAVARGELQIEDCALAADQFGELCKATLWPRLVFGIQQEFTAAEKARVIEGAVDMFLARYGR